MIEVLSLFLTFFQIGLFTIGGGYAMIPLIQQVAIQNGWLSMQDLVDFIAISESTPGPFAVNIATFVGMHMSGLIGAFFTTLGVVLPSFIIILIIAKYFKNFKDNFYVQSVLVGLRPAVIGLITYAIYSIAIVNLFHFDLSGFWNIVDYKAFIILGILILIKILIKKIHPIWLIVLSAFLGILFYGLIPF